MDTLTTPLISRGQRDYAGMLSALQKLLQLAYFEDSDKQLEAVIGISELVQRHSVSASSLGPLCHTLSRLAASEQRAVVAYAARGIKLLVLDDAFLPQATVAGIPSVLAAAILREWEDDGPCLKREVLGALQTLCCDKATVGAVVNAGSLGPVLELLDSRDLELRILSTAIATNTLAFSDSLLLTNEQYIDAFSGRLEYLVDAVTRGDPFVRDYAIAAVANACAHPVLAAHAKEIGVLERFRGLLGPPGAAHVVPCFSSGVGGSSRVGPKQMCETAVARLTGAGMGGGSTGGDI